MVKKSLHPPPQTIAERIALVRGTRSIPEFSDRMGVHLNTQRRYEARDGEDREPPPKYLVRLAELEQVSLSWLLTGQQQESVGVAALSIARCVFADSATKAMPLAEQARIVNATLAFFRGIGIGEGHAIADKNIEEMVRLAAAKMIT